MIQTYAQPNSLEDIFNQVNNKPVVQPAQPTLPDSNNPFSQNSFINKTNYLGPAANSTPNGLPTGPIVPQYPASTQPTIPVTAQPVIRPTVTGTNTVVGQPVTNPVVTSGTTSTGTAVPGSTQDAIIKAGLYNDYLTAEERKALADTQAYQTSVATQTLDPNAEFQNSLKNYQQQIDSINAMYADRVNRARIQGQGRIESRQFAQGRSGQIGSGVGEAGVNAVQAANNDIISSIQSEQANAIADVYSKVRSGADKSLADKTLAKQQGAEALIKHLSEKPEKVKQAAATAVTELLARGVDVSNMTPEEISSFTSGLGVSKEQFTSEFKSQSKIMAEAKAKKDLETAKTQAVINKNNADATKTNFDITNWGKMTDYQKSQIAIEQYKAKNPTGTATEKKANAMGQIAAELKIGTTLADGTPVLDESGQYFTANGLKYMINNAPQLGLTKEEVLQQFGQFIYNDPEKGIPASYGLTPADKKIINGELK